MEIIKVIEDLQIKIKDSNGNIEDMQFIFYETANKLINNYVLQIGDIEIELKELEFYFYDEDKHPDCYTHGDERQTRMGELYVHRINNKYSTNRKRGGIDITFGNGKYYGGILIRGIKIDGKFVAGPANVRQAIAQKLNLIEDIESNFNHGKLQELLDELYKNQKIKINKIKNNKDICCLSTRILPNDIKNYKKYKNALYRFVSKDYLNSNKCKFLKRRPPEITKIKLISYLSGICEDEINPDQQSYQDEKKKIESIVFEYAKSLNKKLRRKK